MDNFLDLNMVSEDLKNIPSSTSGSGSENDGLHNSNCEPGEPFPLTSSSEDKEDRQNGEILRNGDGHVEKTDTQPLLPTNVDKNLVESTSILEVCMELTEEIAVKEETMNSYNAEVLSENGCKIVGMELTEEIAVKETMDSCSPAVLSENGCKIVQDESPSGICKRDRSPVSSQEKDGFSISGIKRLRMAIDEKQPSVHVFYNSLPRDSKQKLQELLQQWSEWHARHYSSSDDLNLEIESGEETYFPAIHVGRDKSSAVSFWMDNQTRNSQSKEFIPLDSNSVPLYDRGYSLGLTSADSSSNLERAMDILDASRCFNCGSYNHSLKECPKPRDNAAVNNARKQLKSKRNLSASSRNPTRYYQDTPGGKYDGLKPGFLEAETRLLLGLGELDPPPWLNRMREIGYPPGYLVPEDEDQPSGITIFAEEESREEKEDGEILDASYPEPSRKMSVEFPGVNAPIPENADKRRWAAESSSFDVSRNRSCRRHNSSLESSTRGHHNEQRWSRDLRDDGPPGCDSISPYASTYSGRSGGYDSSYSSYSQRGNSRQRSPNFERSLSVRERSPLAHENSFNHGSFSPSPYSPSNGLFSSHNHSSASLENRDSNRRFEFASGSSSHHRDTHGRYRSSRR